MFVFSFFPTYVSPFRLLVYSCECLRYTRFALVLKSYSAVLYFRSTSNQWIKSTSSLFWFDSNLSVSNGIFHPFLRCTCTR